MKKPEEYITQCSSHLQMGKYELKQLIKEIQKDTIRATVKECAESAKIDYSYKPITSTTTLPPTIDSACVNKRSILLVEDKLIKEL